jgi:hypothetical protein
LGCAILPLGFPERWAGLGLGLCMSVVDILEGMRVTCRGEAYSEGGRPISSKCRGEGLEKNRPM